MIVKAATLRLRGGNLIAYVWELFIDPDSGPELLVDPGPTAGTADTGPRAEGQD